MTLPSFCPSHLTPCSILTYPLRPPPVLQLDKYLLLLSYCIVCIVLSARVTNRLDKYLLLLSYCIVCIVLSARVTNRLDKYLLLLSYCIVCIVLSARVTNRLDKYLLLLSYCIVCIVLSACVTNSARVTNRVHKKPVTLRSIYRFMQRFDDKKCG